MKVIGPVLLLSVVANGRPHEVAEQDVAQSQKFSEGKADVEAFLLKSKHRCEEVLHSVQTSREKQIEHAAKHASSFGLVVNKSAKPPHPNVTHTPSHGPHGQPPRPDVLPPLLPNDPQLDEPPHVIQDPQANQTIEHPWLRGPAYGLKKQLDSCHERLTDLLSDSDSISHDVSDMYEEVADGSKDSMTFSERAHSQSKSKPASNGTADVIEDFFNFNDKMWTSMLNGFQEKEVRFWREFSTDVLDSLEDTREERSDLGKQLVEAAAQAKNTTKEA